MSGGLFTLQRGVCAMGLRAMELMDLGLRDYADVWKLQCELVELVATGKSSGALILVEHPHVFTAGKGHGGDVPGSINGIPVYKVERGGLWTYHGPGQLVGYPIISLRDRGYDIKGYLKDLEETLIRAVKDFGINAGRLTGHRGVWVGERKLASIGVAVKSWVAFHGFALNVNTDLSYFRMIEPCGLPAEVLTSMREILSKEVSMEEVKRKVVKRFQEVFDVKLTSLTPNTLTQTDQALCKEIKTRKD